MYARFALLPDQAQPLQRSWLVAALSAGTKIIQLGHLCHLFGLSLDLRTMLEAIALTPLPLRPRSLPTSALR